MLGRRSHKSGYSLGVKNNKKGMSMLGQKITPLNAIKNSLISYRSNEPKKSNLEK
jgi:hypothetical protein